MADELHRENIKNTYYLDFADINTNWQYDVFKNAMTRLGIRFAVPKFVLQY